MRSHPGVPAHRAFPVRRREMPLAGVDLDGQPGVRPPGVRYGDQGITAIQAGVEHRHRKTGPDHQNAELALGGRSDTAGEFRILVDRKSTRLNSSHLVISYAV